MFYYFALLFLDWLTPDQDDCNITPTVKQTKKAVKHD